MRGEDFWAVRAEVAENLGSVKLAQAEAALLKGLKDKHPRVRRAVVEALGDVKTAESYKALKGITEKGDASYYVESAAARSLGKIGKAPIDGKEKETNEPVTKRPYEITTRRWHRPQQRDPRIRAQS